MIGMENPISPTMSTNMVDMAFNPVYYNNLIDIVQTSPELHKTAKGIFKQTVWTVVGTIAGGFVGGPLGAAVGGCVGSFVGYMLSEDYRSMIGVLRNLTDEEKQELTKKVMKLVGSASIDALKSFVIGQGQGQALMELLRSSATEHARSNRGHVVTSTEDTSVDPPGAIE